MSDPSLYLFPPKHDDETLIRVKRRMLKAIRLVQRAAIELREIVDSDEIIPPTPEELKLILSGQEEKNIPFEAHLAGVLNLLQFYILEVGVVYEGRLKGWTPKTWDRAMFVSLWGDVEVHLEHAVRSYRVHRKEPKREPLPGYKAWDEPRKKKERA
jgi:hypothetical protein